MRQGCEGRLRRCVAPKRMRSPKQPAAMRNCITGEDVRGTPEKIYSGTFFRRYDIKFFYMIIYYQPAKFRFLRLRHRFSPGEMFSGTFLPPKFRLWHRKKRIQRPPSPYFPFFYLPPRSKIKIHLSAAEIINRGVPS